MHLITVMYIIMVTLSYGETTQRINASTSVMTLPKSAAAPEFKIEKQILFAAPVLVLAQSTDQSAALSYSTACSVPEDATSCSQGGTRFLQSPTDVFGIADASVTVGCSYLCCSASDIAWTVNEKPLAFAAQTHTSVSRITDPVTSSVVTARRMEITFALTDSNRVGYYQCHVVNGNGVKISSGKALVRYTDTVAVNAELRVASMEFNSALSDPSSTEFKALETTVANTMRESSDLHASDIIHVQSFKKGSVIADVLIVRRIHTQAPVCQQPPRTIKTNDTMTIVFSQSYTRLVQIDCCYQETSQQISDSEIITWPATERGLEATTDCPYADYDATVQATRSCDGDSTNGAKWSYANTTMCPEKANLTLNLATLANETRNSSENAVSTVNKLVALVNVTTINAKTDLNLIGEILTGVIENTKNDTEARKKISYDVFKVINELMGLLDVKLVKANHDFNSSNLLLSTLAVTAPYLANSNNSVTKLENLIVVQPKEPPPVFSLLQLNITEDDNPSTAYENFTIPIHDNIPAPAENSSFSNITGLFSIPAETFRSAWQIINKTNSSLSMPRPVFVIFNAAKLFQNKLGSNEQKSQIVNTDVVKIYFPGVHLENLDPPIVISMKPINEKGIINSSRCVFWDVLLDDSRGNWSSRGCNFKGMRDGLVICECNHMTSFTVLMDILQDESLPQASMALNIITYIGCGLSLIGLILTLITYLGFRKMRRQLLKSRPPKILLCLCGTMAVTLLVFLIGIDDKRGPVLCKINAAVLHYCILSTFIWTLIEGVNLYFCFVKIMGNHVSRFMLKASIASWGLPLLIVGVTMGTRYQQDYGTTQFCIVTGISFYVTWLAPICIVIIVNFVIIILVWRALTKSSSVSKDKRMDGLGKARIFISCTILLGLTWVLGMLAIGDLRLPFQYAFAIVNSLQGFGIFFFYCLLNRDGRLEWLRFVKREKRGTTSYSSSGQNRSVRDWNRKRTERMTWSNTNRSSKKSSTSSTTKRGFFASIRRVGNRRKSSASSTSRRGSSHPSEIDYTKRKSLSKMDFTEIGRQLLRRLQSKTPSPGEQKRDPTGGSYSTNSPSDSSKTTPRESPTVGPSRFFVTVDNLPSDIQEVSREEDVSVTKAITIEPMPLPPIPEPEIKGNDIEEEGAAEPLPQEGIIVVRSKMEADESWQEESKDDLPPVKDADAKEKVE